MLVGRWIIEFGRFEVIAVVGTVKYYGTYSMSLPRGSHLNVPTPCTCYYYYYYYSLHNEFRSMLGSDRHNLSKNGIKISSSLLILVPVAGQTKDNR